jgi:hypothetical protein
LEELGRAGHRSRCPAPGARTRGRLRPGQNGTERPCATRRSPETTPQI